VPTAHPHHARSGRPCFFTPSQYRVARRLRRDPDGSLSITAISRPVAFVQQRAPRTSSRIRLTRPRTHDRTVVSLGQHKYRSPPQYVAVVAASAPFVRAPPIRLVRVSAYNPYARRTVAQLVAPLRSVVPLPSSVITRRHCDPHVVRSLSFPSPLCCSRIDSDYWCTRCINFVSSSFFVVLIVSHSIVSVFERERLSSYERVENSVSDLPFAPVDNVFLFLLPSEIRRRQSHHASAATQGLNIFL